MFNAQMSSPAMKFIAGMIVYNNLRLFGSKDYRDEKLVSVRVLTHLIDSVSYPAAIIYLPVDVIMTEKYVRERNDFSTNRMFSLGLMMTAPFS
jgi:hypothetical protein